MQEEAHPVDASAPAQASCDRNEMIVMRPDNVGRTQNLDETLGKLLVHAKITRGVAGAQIGEIEAIMADRPKHLVGEADVIFVDIAARKVGHSIADGPEGSHMQGGIEFLAHSARPPEPDAASRLERRL